MVAKGGPGGGAVVGEPVKLFEKGTVVEVGSDEEGFKDAWYVAVVIDVPSTSPPSKKRTKSTDADKYLIQYRTLLDDDGSTPLRELVKPEFVRPLPVPPESDKAHNFSVFEVVDAFSRDGWWTGVITRIVDYNTLIVAFQNPPDVVEFRVSDLRVHRSWIDGKWVRPENKRCTSKSMFRPGMKVEVSFDNDDYRDVWFPATVLEDLGNESFMVEYQTVGTGNNKVFLKGIADLLHIRPSPIFPKERKFVLLEKVDAFYNFCWWSGVITKELAGRKYIVYFKHKIKEMEFNYSDLRPHVQWKDGEWSASSAGIVIHSNTQEQVRSHSISTDDSQMAVDSNTNSGTKKGHPAAKTPRSLDHGENQTLESMPCNGNPSSNGMTPARKITSPKTPAIDASQSRPSKKGQGDAPRTTSLNTCELNTATTEVPSKENLSLTSTSVDLAPSGNDNSATRKRGRPPKSLQADADVLQTDPESTKRSNPTRSKRATNQTVEKHPAKRLKSPIGKKTQPPNSEIEEPSSNMVGVDRSGKETESSVQDSQQASRGKRGKKDSETRNTAEGTGDAIDEVPSRESEDQPLSEWFEGTHSPQAVSDSGASPKRKAQRCSKTNDRQVELINGTPAAGDEAGRNHSVAFARTSPLWQMIDGMEVFQVLPQNPHFGPLNSCKESCREGLAIGCMVTFSSVAKKIKELHFDDPRSSIEENLETLRELESQGFDVKKLHDRLNGLLMIKDKHKLLEARSVELHTQVVERVAEKTKSDEEIEEIDKQIRELQEKRAVAVSKKVVDSEIESLKASEESVVEGIRSIHEDFEKLATSPWV